MTQGGEEAKRAWLGPALWTVIVTTSKVVYTQSLVVTVSWATAVVAARTNMTGR
ncbi:MAG: hypothetical protein IPI34_02755 [bacterium]|nr:hypothetical protein [bacterium]